MRPMRTLLVPLLLVGACGAQAKYVPGTKIPDNSQDFALLANTLFQSKKKEAMIAEAAGQILADTPDEVWDGADQPEHDAAQRPADHEDHGGVARILGHRTRRGRIARPRAKYASTSVRSSSDNQYASPNKDNVPPVPGSS